jgi:hypothetical protein
LGLGPREVALVARHFEQLVWNYQELISDFKR